MALSHGINANIVHRWLREQTTSALVPVTLEESPPGPAPHAELDIRVEMQRANSAIVVKWPLQDSAACAVWLRGWLR